MPTIKNFPKFRQFNNDTCGASALHAILAYYGIDFKENSVARLSGTTSSGTPTGGIKRVAKFFGLDVKESQMMTAEDLKKNIRNGIPTIIGIQAWARKNINLEKEWRQGHFVVPIKYDKNRIYFADPACILTTYLTFTELEKIWRDKDKFKGKWRKLDHYGMSFSGRKPFNSINNAIHIGSGKNKLARGYLYADWTKEK